jgi:hypothetical protein
MAGKTREILECPGTNRYNQRFRACMINPEELSILKNRLPDQVTCSLIFYLSPYDIWAYQGKEIHYFSIIGATLFKWVFSRP